MTSVEIVLPADNSNRNYSLGISITSANGTNISTSATIYINNTTQNIANISSSVTIPMPSTANSSVEVS